MLRGLLSRGEEQLTSWRTPPTLRGRVRAEADALVEEFRWWHEAQKGASWVPDCQHIATAVGRALELRGHTVYVIGGVARGSDAPGYEPSVHYWLTIDGKHYDPKEVLLRREDKSFRYLDRVGEWRWDIQTALDNGVEECPVLGAEE